MPSWKEAAEAVKTVLLPFAAVATVATIRKGIFGLDFAIGVTLFFAAATFLAFRKKKRYMGGDRDFTKPLYVRILHSLALSLSILNLVYVTTIYRERTELVSAAFLSKQSFESEERGFHRIELLETSSEGVSIQDTFQSGDKFRFEFELASFATWRFYLISPKGDVTEAGGSNAGQLSQIEWPSDWKKAASAHFDESDKGVRAFVLAADSKQVDGAAVTKCMESAGALPTKIDQGVEGHLVRIGYEQIGGGSALSHLRNVSSSRPKNLDVLFVVYVRVL